VAPVATVTPFRVHVYAGIVPPKVGVAVKVTRSPAHIGLRLAVMVTDGVVELGLVTVTPIILKPLPQEPLTL